jgi:hypothetical protein
MREYSFTNNSYIADETIIHAISYFDQKYLKPYSAKISFVVKDKDKTSCNGFVLKHRTLIEMMISASPGRPKEFIKTLMHEMIHIHQMLRGDLDSAPGGTVWQSIVYGKEFIRRYNLTGDYESLPWEVEAYDNDEFEATDYIIKNNVQKDSTTAGYKGFAGYIRKIRDEFRVRHFQRL